MVNLILFPSSFYSTLRVDEDLQSEYDAVISTGLFDVVFFEYHKWFDKEQLMLSKTPTTMQKAIMRGWMMKPAQYSSFYKQLLEQNIELITTPEEYEQMHIFPNIYSFFGEDTALMKVYPLHTKIDIIELRKYFTRFMVKDYVKSVKGTEFPKFFDVSVTQEEFDEWMKVFYKYRGNLLTGGICIKEFLDLKMYHNKPNEFRIFYANGEIVSLSRNSGQGNYTEEPDMELIEKYRGLPSKYYTVDMAELVDGTWKVIEAGDGSVSGLSEFQDAKQYFRALYYVLNE